MKRSAAALVLAATGALAAAGETPPLEDRLVQCWNIQKPDDRLACFDREAAPLARAQVARSASAARPVVTPAPPLPAQEVVQSTEAPRQVAATPPAQPPPAPEPSVQDPSVVHARIVELRRSGISSYQVLLDNGQSWQHENEYLGQYLQKGEAVTITRAALGNYRLTRDAGKSRDWIRVTRVR